MVDLASDYIVEVRDVNFIRKGQIDPAFLDLKTSEVFRSVGKWELRLPAEHPLLPTLKTKGSGIIVTKQGSSRPFSGRMQTCTLSQDAEDPKGTWVVAGVDDNIVAAATSVFPDPANLPNAQTKDYWTRTSDAEDCMKVMVSLNGGPSSIASRKYAWLTTATNLHRGPSLVASLRFDNMGDALTSLGTRGNLGWRFYQSGAGIVFDVFQPADKTALIRLDIRNGGLESTELGFSAPTATQALVLGQGEGAARTVRPVTSTASLAEATAWGLRWEVVKDERNTNDPTELDQAGQEILTEQGSTINSLKVTPADAPNQKLGIDWDLGDLVTVVIDDQPTTATVTEIARSISSEGVITQVTVGDPVGFDWEAQVGQAISDHDSRISDLETAIGTGLTQDVEFNKIILDSTADASLTSTGHAIQVGPTSGANLIIDNNEVMARNNGAASSLFLNADGGNVGLGDASSTVTINGRQNSAHTAWAQADGIGLRSGLIAAAATAQITVTFPTGRFTQAPIVTATSTNSRITVGINTVSATSVTFDLSNWSSGSTTAAFNVHWHAEQMTSASAAG